MGTAMMLRHLSILAIALIIAGVGCDPIIPWPAKEKYITQYVSHFSFPSTPLTFSQRYLYEDKYYKPGGPILFYCGNEGDIESFWKNTGFMFTIAPSMNAYIIFGEHRYYGKSLPFAKSFEQPYIQFLTVEQALADFAFMITKIKSDNKQLNDAPVIAFGGSYGGELAAYARVMYPHIFDGALSASAPLYWTSGLKNIHGFFEAVTKDYAEANPKCVDIIKTGFNELLSLADKGSEGFQEATKRLQLCDALKDKNDLLYATKWLRNAFVMISMMDYPYESTFLAPMPAYPVNVSCDAAISSGRTDAIAGLRDAAAVMYNKPNGECFPFRDQFIECADITGCGLGNDSIAWDFQACTELHMYDDSNATVNDMFPSLPLTRKAVSAYCKAKYGVTRREYQLATIFSPRSWKQSSNIIFSNGDLDPWRNGGILEDLSDTVVALTVHGGAHHLDLRSDDPKDPQSVTEVRQKEVTLINKWIQEANLRKQGMPKTWSN